MTDNPFASYGEEISSGLRRKLRIAETRREKAIERKKLEEEILLDLWSRSHKDLIATLLAGPHGVAAAELIAVLEKLPSSGELIALFDRGPWQHADLDTKFIIQHLINRAIINHRERAGLEPYDDPLPGDGLNVFLTIRGKLYANVHA